MERTITIKEPITICKTPWSKARGMMFRTKPKLLLFVFQQEQIVPLHMFFVFFPIDVIFLDKKNRVVEIKERFRPFTFYTPRKKAWSILEANAGFAKKKNIKIGCRLKI
jgi:uncharacterized protein